MRIFLVRHAESEGNVNKKVHLEKADHAIDISDLGVEQAALAGAALQKHLLELKVDRVRLWMSPYQRTRITAGTILPFLNDPGHPWEIDCRENIMLCEQQFGLFDGIPDDELPIKYPNEYAHYKKQEEFGGRFWAPMPLGESRFDVATRIHQSFGTFHRDRDKHGIENIIVICHGVTLRAFVMMWLHHPYEWFDKEPNPVNCSIRMVEDGVDKGYVHPGGPVDAGLPGIKATLSLTSTAVGRYGGPF